MWDVKLILGGADALKELDFLLTMWDVKLAPPSVPKLAVDYFLLTMWDVKHFDVAKGTSQQNIFY